MDKIVPITLITGFLGSGKTTLINSILKAKPSLKVSVILNEFGDTKLESQFVNSHKGDIIELTNGCMCCVAQDDFARVIRWILSEKPETEHILIEASGLSDPLPIASTILESDISEHVHLETIMCVLDAINFFEMKEKYTTVMVQLSNSDMVLISKGTEVKKDEIEKIKNFVSVFLPRVQTYEITEELSYDLVLNTEHAIRPERTLTEHVHEHEEVQTLFWKSEHPLDFTKINTLLKRLPSTVIRVKGILNLLDEKNKASKLLLQYVGARSEVTESSWAQDEKPHTALLFIGKDFDTHVIEKELLSSEIH